MTTSTNKPRDRIHVVSSVGRDLVVSPESASTSGSAGKRTQADYQMAGTALLN